MKKTLTTIIILVALCLSLAACSEPNTQPETAIYTQSETTALEVRSHVSYSFDDLSFEEAISEYATDAVIAKYVSHRPFGEMKTLMEYEFVVLDRVWGNAADTIFVYTSVLNIGENLDALNPPDGFTDSEYLLILEKIGQPITHTHEDGFTFIRSIVIDLDEPSRSTMNGELLTSRSDSGEMLANSSSGLDFSRNISRESIVSYVREQIKDNPPSRELIKSEKLEDIINNSPYVLVVEVNELLNSPRTDWTALDIYYCTAVKVLNGDINLGFEFLVSFPADTVRPGEQHIIAVQQLEEGSNNWFIFTSRNSLFGMERLEEIMRYC